MVSGELEKKKEVGIMKSVQNPKQKDSDIKVTLTTIRRKMDLRPLVEILNKYDKETREGACDDCQQINTLGDSEGTASK